MLHNTSVNHSNRTCEQRCDRARKQPRRNMQHTAPASGVAVAEPTHGLVVKDVSSGIVICHVSHASADLSSTQAHDPGAATNSHVTNLITRHTQPLNVLPQRSSTCKSRMRPTPITHATHTNAHHSRLPAVAALRSLQNCSSSEWVAEVAARRRAFWTGVRQPKIGIEIKSA